MKPLDLSVFVLILAAWLVGSIFGIYGLIFLSLVATFFSVKAVLLLNVGNARLRSGVYFFSVLFLVTLAVLPVWGKHSAKGMNDEGIVGIYKHRHYIWKTGHLH